MRFDQDPVAYSAAALLLPFVGLYAAWTMLHTAATLLHIPWSVVKLLAIPALAFGAAATFPAGRALLRGYSADLPQTACSRPSLGPAAGVVALTGWLSCQPDYSRRYLLAVAVFLFAALGSFRPARRKPVRPQPTASADVAPRFALPVFCGLVCLALAFTLTAYRSDYDDSVYLQFAVQTMLHPERAPLTYDVSLGALYEAFRSPIYRFSAFENFAALLAEASGLHLMGVYYLLLPAVGALLALCAAYLLARRFLDAHAALTATGIFVLLLIVWGDNHYTFGNLALVRLYQGKCWLVTVAVPFVVLSGLALLRDNRFALWTCYAAGNIAAAGLSTNGMLIACGTGLLLAPAALTGSLRRSLGNLSLLGLGLAYPLFCMAALFCMLEHPSLENQILEQFRLLIYSH